MSRIWLAVDEKTEAQVVVKHCALPDGLTVGQRELMRDWVLPEAVAASRVEHPNVIHTIDVLPSWDGPWIVMEYLPSRSLHQVIDETGPLSPVRVARIGLVLVSALRAAGRAGVLHLDVKPGNVLITTEGRVVLTDFGPLVTPNGIRTLADAGVVLGSPKYIAPERIFDHAADERADLWSLGATLYHAVEGRPPFLRPTTAEVLRAIGAGRPEQPRRAGPLAPVLAGLLRRDPSDRPSMTGAEWALRGVVEASRRRSRSATRRRIPAILAAVAVTTTLTTVAATAQGETRAGTDTAAPASSATVTIAAAGPDRPAVILPAPDRSATDPAGSATVLSAPAGSAAAPGPGGTTDAPGAAGDAAAPGLAGDDAQPGRGGAAGRPGPAVPPAPVVPPDPTGFATVPADRRNEAPPRGHTWWNGPDGYRIAVPQGWRRRDIPGGTAFRAGADRLQLGITALAQPPADVVAELEIAELETYLPGYRRLRLEALPTPSAAVWEYTFHDRDGTVMRSLRRVTISGGRAFVLEWQSTRESWAAHLPDFTAILASFTTRP
ncbi:serine/threonine-protein kinase [Actinoplanes sp. CA-252034]|uniref:serine/threonine-protein kinase n=1 Tax=Actinoplanes sp. CA-252034 TaxID=3239906 RepID=UPI003D99A38A